MKLKKEQLNKKEELSKDEKVVKNYLKKNANNNKVDLKLKKYVESVESIEVKISVLSEERSEIYKKAKKENFNVKGMKRIITLRKMPREERRELEQIIKSYKQSLQMEFDV